MIAQNQVDLPQCFFIEIAPETKTLSWVRAGHEPPLLYHAANHEFSELQAGGLVLGIDNSYEYQENITKDLAVGDIILIGTDGISEARNKEGEFFGKERIKDCLLQLAQKSAKEIQTELLSKLANFSDSHTQEDDITLVLIKVTA